MQQRQHILYETGLSLGARVLWGILESEDIARQERRDPGPLVFSQAQLASLMGKKANTVRSYQQELVRGGWLKTVKCGGGNQYRTVMP